MWSKLGFGTSHRRHRVWWSIMESNEMRWFGLWGVEESSGELAATRVCEFLRTSASSQTPVLCLNSCHGQWEMQNPTWQVIYGVEASLTGVFIQTQWTHHVCSIKVLDRDLQGYDNKKKGCFCMNRFTMLPFHYIYSIYIKKDWWFENVHVVLLHRLCFVF